MTFDSIILTNDSINTDDMFLAKYDAAGNVLWAKSAGGIDSIETTYAVATTVTSDPLGNVLVAGWFGSGIINFGSITLTNTNADSYDMFLAKYNAFGNILWAKSAGEENDEQAFSVTTDVFGDRKSVV